MELKDMKTWDEFSVFLDAAYISMVKNGITPIYAITDPTTFERIQDALFEHFCPNEKPNRDAFTIELSFPFIGTLPLSRGMGNDKPYLFFIHGALYNEPKKVVTSAELTTNFDDWVSHDH